ncbi:hypothetical protein MBLNU230_g2066t1 [Neophaeotheca triangularis]
MVREDLVEGAITFLNDPSVSSAAVDQKVAFLKSKNLTQEEIDAAFARVGQAPPPPQQQPTAQYTQPYRPAPQQQQYGQYQQYQQWNQPPPEMPRRDWRDWFIAATVMGGFGYAVYWTAKRYVYPLIAPPTPPQLEQDKASVDESFDKAFALLDQLATDTQELKDSEKSRTERLDKALGEVESVIGITREANENREADSRRMARELGDIREQIPKALEKEREGTDERLRDLATEMKSLKTLVGNRMSAGPAPQQRATPSYLSQQPTTYTPSSGTATAASAPTPAPAPESTPMTNGTNGVGATNGTTEESEKPAATTGLPDRSSSASPYNKILGNKAAIPAWQLQAKKKAEEAKKTADAGAGPDTSESGTATEAEASSA